MIGAVTDYFTALAHQFGQGWNRFWFTPRDARALCILRILTGVVALWWLVSYTPDLLRWFGPHGLLPVESARFVAGVSPDSLATTDFSYLWWARSPVSLWLLHAAGILILLMLTVGCFTRVSSVLSLLVLLSYIHRGPMITGQVEPVLTMLIAYLCLAPAGRHWSVDRWWHRRSPTLRVGAGSESDLEQPPPSVAATISIRLIQLHTAAFYLLMGLTQLGAITWWSGDAVWWLIAQSESRLVDLTRLRDHIYLLNAWTHAIVFFELALPVLIWNRSARPLLLGLAIAMWASLALITGLVSFCLVMLIASSSFVEPEMVRGK